MKLLNRGVAVFCGSSAGSDPAYMLAATQVGQVLATRGATLVYGGGSIGLMTAAADAALLAGGKVVGVIPHFLATAEVAHASVAEMIRVETMHERKAIMSARSAAYLTLPGGFGTYDELLEIITWRQLGLHDKPIVLINVRGFFDGLLAQIDHAIAEGFIRQQYRRLFQVVDSAQAAIAYLEKQPEPVGSREELA